MPQCLHPFTIVHPTVRKWRNDLFAQNIVPTRQMTDDFCSIHGIESHMEIPCGKCLYCYRRKQEMWRIRLQQEQKSSFVSYFVTLTYDELNVPLDGVSKSDVQKFFKRFRHNMAIPLRYFCISEYGPHGTHRAHYHFALFFTDYVGFEDVYNELDRSWNKGEINLQELCDGRIQYISTYCIKFFNKSPVGQNPNFMLCSRKPFIGSGFLNKEMVDNMRNKMLPYMTVNGFKKPIPQIYRDRIFDDDMKVQLRELANLHRVYLMDKLVDIHGSIDKVREILQDAAERDYRNAWRKYKESKKL